MSFRILIVEDSDMIRESICDYITDKSEGSFDVVTAADGDEAMEIIRDNSFDLVVLDIMLPGASGFEICKSIRRQSDCPIIFLTALSGEDNLIRGYELGADDYVVKPFSQRGLYAKMWALLKRSNGIVRDEKITCGGITLDPLRMVVTLNGEEVILPQKEYIILKVLMKNKGKVFNRESLIKYAWDIAFDGNDRVVDTHIKKLRKALGDESKHIKTVIGGGYKMVD